MNIRYHKTFQKQAVKLKPAQTKRLKSALKLFEKDLLHPILRNHALTGRWKGYRSISFGGDWRVHFTIKDKKTVLLVAIGTHSELYR